jgi:hypothetical protein
MRMKHLFSLALLALGACQPQPDLAEEARVIREVWEGGGRALENRDFEAYTNFWANNERIQVMHPDVPEWLVGWTALGPQYEERMRGGLNSGVEPAIGLSMFRQVQKWPGRP